MKSGSQINGWIIKSKLKKTSKDISIPTNIFPQRFQTLSLSILHSRSRPLLNAGVTLITQGLVSLPVKHQVTELLLNTVVFLFMYLFIFLANFGSLMKLHVCLSVNIFWWCGYFWSGWSCFGKKRCSYGQMSPTHCPASVLLWFDAKKVPQAV